MDVEFWTTQGGAPEGRVAPKGGSPKWGPEGWGPMGGGPKISHFFPFSATIFFLLSSLEVLPWNHGSRPNLAKPDLAILIWPNWPIFVDRILAKPHLANFVSGGGPEGRGPGGVGARTQKKWGPEGWGPGRVGAGRVGGPEGGGPKISRFFFFLSLLPEISLSSRSGGLLVEFWWCLKRRDAQMCTFGLSGCRRGVELWPLFKAMHGPQNAGWCHSVKPRRA